MSAGSEANPPDGISLPEEHERKVTALRQALIEGENSGEAAEIDIRKVKAKARQRSSS
jgi:antitoxin ParD1/3/4